MPKKKDVERSGVQRVNDIPLSARSLLFPSCRWGLFSVCIARHWFCLAIVLTSCGSSSACPNLGVILTLVTDWRSFFLSGVRRESCLFFLVGTNSVCPSKTRYDYRNGSLSLCVRVCVPTLSRRTVPALCLRRVSPYCCCRGLVCHCHNLDDKNQHS